MTETREKMSVVIVGHVDHGKSTILGRLLSDTGNVPKGKLEEIKERCRRNSKTFEYAFLLDALKDEQSQGITIDSARCFAKSKKRDYILIDAPGHIDFLKNMVSGAARAEAAVLVVDAAEGVKENSRRHGYLLSMLGIRQIAVCVNKMDLVEYSQSVFDGVKNELTLFLAELGIVPVAFVPASARDGDNLTSASKNTSWYRGHDLLSLLDSFVKAPPLKEKPFRMPVQDVYKFTNEGDGRRTIAGRIESGIIEVGDEVVFYPSGRRSKIKSVEMFGSRPKSVIEAGYCTGFTLSKEVYVQPGEIMCKASEGKPTFSGTEFKANIFWMGETPLVTSKEYKLKLGTSKVFAKVLSINRVLDPSTLVSSESEVQVKKHDTAECVIETVKPIAFDVISDSEGCGRFVIVDGFEISGGGIILAPVEKGKPGLREKVDLREIKWVRSDIVNGERLKKYARKPSLILITGRKGVNKIDVGKKLEADLNEKGYPAYYIGIKSIIYGVDSDIASIERFRDEHLRRLAEVLHILLDAGLTVIATASDLNEDDVDNIRTILKGQEMKLVVIGENPFVEDMVNLKVDGTLSPEDAASKISLLLPS